jgi:tRNA threonylcarbamoyladenosine biosynthesis protein TsaE
MFGVEYITNSVSETIQRGMKFATELKHGDAVLLSGDMGAGKTHFVKGMAMGLGITQPVTSPTYALVNDYGKMFHFDFFRAEGIDDIEAIGFRDYIGKGIIAVEWANKVPKLAKAFDKAYNVKITKRKENERVIEINEATNDVFGL